MKFQGARNRPALHRSLVSLGSAAVIISLVGCQVAPSKTVTGAGTGAAAGAVVGGLAAGATGGNSSQGLLAGAGAGAIIGGIVGLTQEMKERKEQDRLAQERAYQQELARKRAEEAKNRALLDEELAVAQGFQISDLELTEAQKKVDSAAGRLAKLREERTAALSKKKALDEANEKLLSTEAEIVRLEEELARLKNAPVETVTATTDPTAAPSPN
ncbi:hypothetical protein Verru16b_00729 [Lacunisphaera limnophila]|uniref:Glycine zipper domain-containing protein n=1 Tax=Lacunisphaera limnophila TaxID=1838286 RepID=A0A1D8AS21_9BACT|nr:hypothetical protein [Lacunisphaera limnophila]AOS43677.1 hypothetical protein Verru16b_00729 [Lacunisphaera limnophila]